MSLTNFPTSLDTWTDKTDNVDNVIASHVNKLQDSVAALESKVGIDDSAVAISLDYQISDNIRQVNLLTNSGFGVWSNSTLENVGSDLITNGGFDSDTTGWTPTDCTIASIAGGQSGNCLELTRTAEVTQRVNQTVSGFSAGKLYKAVCYVKSGTSGDEDFQFGLYMTGAWAGLISGVTSGTWTEYSFIFEATESSGDLSLKKLTATAGTMLFDTVTAYEVTPGCVAADGKGPDGWRKLNTGDIYREHDGTNIKDGSFYSLKSVPTVQYDIAQWPLLDLQTSESFYKQFSGRTVTFGAWVKSSTATDALIYIYDGVTYSTSSKHTGGGGWEWIEITKTVSNSATLFNVTFQHSNASPGIAYFSQPMLVFGSSIGEGNYVAPQNEIIFMEDSITLTDYDGDDTVSTDADINLEAQTDGKIPKGAKCVYGRLIGQCTTAGKYLQLDDGSNVIGTTIYSQVSNILNSGIGWIPCDLNGDIAITRDSTFANVKIDITGVQL